MHGRNKCNKSFLSLNKLVMLRLTEVEAVEQEPAVVGRVLEEMFCRKSELFH